MRALAALTLAVAAGLAAAAPTPNICGQNRTIGEAVVAAVNLSWPGLGAAKSAAASGDLSGACDAIAAYYRTGSSAPWLRIPPVKPGTGRAGGKADAMVDHDEFTGFPSPAGEVKIPRNADGGLEWTWYGPDDDDEFMNVLNRHGYYGTLLEAWNSTGNNVYPAYFDALVKDWVLHLPCNNAAVKGGADGSEASHASTGAGSRSSEGGASAPVCVPLGDQSPGGSKFCAWDAATGGGRCATGTFESPWRSLEMGIRMGGPWPQAFFGFQQSDAFTVDARVLMLLAVSEHIKALVVDGGHPGRGTVNWEMTQWRGLLGAAGTWPELAGAAEASTTAMRYLTALLESGVYEDGVENEMASGYDMGTAGDYYAALQTIKQAGLPPAPASFSSRVEAMYEYGAYVSSPIGCMPQNGDSDICGGGFDAAAATFFNRHDWDYVRTNGAFGTKPSGPGHETPSVMFPWAGQAVLRGAYEANATWVWFDVGPFGSNPFHAHRDKLSLQLQAHGSMFLMDSGRFAYAGTSFSHSLRPYCHSTQAHNTLRIDGKQQQQAPALATSPRPASSWSFEADHDVVQGSMSLYDGLEGSATHSRSVYHQRNQWFVVVDVVSSDRGGRTVQAAWHCHPNATVRLNPSGSGAATVVGVDWPTGLSTSAVLAVVPATGAHVTRWASSGVVSGQLAGKNGAVEDQGWYSHGYVDAEAAPVIVYNATLASTQRQAVFAWLLLPSATAADAARTSGASAEVTAVSAGGVSVTVVANGDTARIEVPFESSHGGGDELAARDE